VGEGVDAKGGLLNKANAENSGVDESTEPIIPEDTADGGREDQSHEQNALDEVAVLPDNNGVFVEVGNIGSAGVLGVLLENHPAEMGVEKTLADGVGVLDGVGISVVSTVIPGPPPDRALHGASANGRKVDLEGSGGLVRAVCPKTVVT
jgi:hypothetical protein